MALKAELEELLKTLPADVQAQQRAILEKHPTLGDGWLRQADYNKFMNEGQDKLKRYDETMDWYKRTKPVHDQVVTDLAASQAEVERLKAEVASKAAEAAAAKAASGEGATDPAAVAKAVLEAIKGTIPTTAEIGKLIADETDKQAKAAREKFFKEDVPPALAFQTGMNEVQWRHRDEFGKPLNRVEFAKFMTENKINDPIEAYERFTETPRLEAKLKAAKDEGIAEGKKQAAAEFVPGSTGAQGLGHLQVRITEKKTGDPLFGQDVELGDNAAAMAAAAELRNEGRV